MIGFIGEENMKNKKETSEERNKTEFRGCKKNISR